MPGLQNVRALTPHHLNGLAIDARTLCSDFAALTSHDCSEPNCKGN